MSEIFIRILEAKDTVDVEKIYNLYWNDLFLQKLSLKLKEFSQQSKKAIKEKVRYFIAERNGEILGAISFRDCPDPMKKYTTTDNPLEIYILAAKRQGEGVGKILLEKALEEGSRLNYTEAVLYNSDSHQESRGFYLHLGFEDAGQATAPDGELGHVFRRSL